MGPLIPEETFINDTFRQSQHCIVGVSVPSLSKALDEDQNIRKVF